MDHPTKDMIRFSARREACLDDIEMFALSPTTTSNAPDSKREVNHLYVAKLWLRKLKNVELTEKQRTKFNQMSADLRARIDALRSKAGITQQLIKRRDEVYSQLKKTSLTGDQLWKTLQEEAGLTDTQRDAFRETLRQNKQFRSDVLKLLTPEQRAKFAKRR